MGYASWNLTYELKWCLEKNVVRISGRDTIALPLAVDDNPSEHIFRAFSLNRGEFVSFVCRSIRVLRACDIFIPLTSNAG